MKGADFTKWLIGGFLIFLGIGFLGDQLFNISFGTILNLAWPIFIMILGVYIMFRTHSQFLLGSLVFIVGVVSLADNFLVLPFTVWNLWPLILIFIGIRIIFGDVFGFFKLGDRNISENVDSTAIFWADQRKIKSQNFKSGKITVLFGGSELDLTETKFADGAVIDIVCIFGGVSLKMNSNTQVLSEGIGLFGGFEDKSNKADNSSQKVEIKGVAIFGGVEIKN